ncbi:MAG: OadG family protein [Pseudomonadales bacterium]|nr:OadG family protein [Pseudomonadales bacterium]
MHSDVLMTGIELMLAGMGTVILFLTLLILATTAMSYLLARWSLEEASAVSEEELVAISAAVHRHRHRGKRVDGDS